VLVGLKLSKWAIKTLFFSNPLQQCKYWSMWLTPIFCKVDQTDRISIANVKSADHACLQVALPHRAHHPQHRIRLLPEHRHPFRSCRTVSTQTSLKLLSRNGTT